MSEELRSDICVIGGGPAGIAVATAAANNAVPVVLVERGKPGGGDLARGSVPSKALLAAAGLYESLRRGPMMGVSGAPLQVSFAKIREHILAVTEAIARNVSAERLSALGVRVVSAAGHFVDRHTLVAGDVVIRARRFVVATGSRPARPKIIGTKDIEYLTTDTAFDISRKTAHLIVLGATAEGLELAQAYNRLGIDATVISTLR